MDMKNACAVCLISLFSATLVVLIARSLDLQSTSRLEPQLARIADQFEIQVPVVVLVRINGGEIGDWKRLDRVWALVNKPTAFADNVRSEIRQMLDDEAESDTPDLPVPGSESEEDIIPDTVPDIPIPE